MEFDANNLKISLYIYLILFFGPPRFPVSTLPSMVASPLHGPPWSTCCGARGSEWCREPHPLTSAGLRETPWSGGDRPWSVAAHCDRWVAPDRPSLGSSALGNPRHTSAGGAGRRWGPLHRPYWPHFHTGPLQPLWEAPGAQSRGCGNRGPVDARALHSGAESLSRALGRVDGTGWHPWPWPRGPAVATPMPSCSHRNPVLEGMPGLALGNPTCSRGPFPNWLLGP